MQVQAIGAITANLPLAKPSTVATGESFGDLLSQALNDLNQVQTHADNLVQQLAAGGDVELHDVMIAQEQANVSFQLAVQVRNRVLEAYQEIMRMQV